MSRTFDEVFQRYWKCWTDAERLERMKADRDALDNDIRALASKMAREYALGEMAEAKSIEPED